MVFSIPTQYHKALEHKQTGYAAIFALQRTLRGESARCMDDAQDVEQVLLRFIDELTKGA